MLQYNELNPTFPQLVCDDYYLATPIESFKPSAAAALRFEEPEKVLKEHGIL